MFQKSLVIGFTCVSMALAISNATAQTAQPAAQAAAPAGVKLTAAAIVEKNVAARGGLQAWRAVQTMSMSGKVGAGGNQRAATPVPRTDRRVTPQALPQRPAEEAQLPFVMEMKRPRKTRFELQFAGKTAVQVYDGATGWKLRPYLNRNVVEPYTADELKMSSLQADLDGPLVDYAQKGTQVELEGNEKVEARDTYKLKLTTKEGTVSHIWIDSKTFLEAKVEGQPRKLDGVLHPVEVFYRDYRAVSGLQISFTVETRVLPVARQAKQGVRNTPPVPPEKITVEKVLVNPKLDDTTFSKPELTIASNVN